MARQAEEDVSEIGQPAATSLNAMTPAAKPAAPARDPYAVGPTNYESFDRAYSSNARASQDEASRLNTRVSGEARAAQQALQQTYGADQQPSDALRTQFSNARHDRDALGSDAGVQALSGPHASAWGAALTRRAGRGAFEHTQKAYAGLDTALAAKEQQHQKALTDLAAKEAADLEQADFYLNAGTPPQTSPDGLTDAEWYAQHDNTQNEQPQDPYKEDR